MLLSVLYRTSVYTFLLTNFVGNNITNYKTIVLLKNKHNHHLFIFQYKCNLTILFKFSNPTNNLYLQFDKIWQKNVSKLNSFLDFVHCSRIVEMNHSILYNNKQTHNTVFSSNNVEKYNETLQNIYTNYIIIKK